MGSPTLATDATSSSISSPSGFSLRCSSFSAICSLLVVPS
uniref:Uncharacterized protein n=1 Tax=Rhizophora mucronata TaxID=61149 RepID=A0A2P2JV74_RHIMU